LSRSVAKADENDYARYLWGQEPGAAAWVAMWALQSALISVPVMLVVAVLQSPRAWYLIWTVPPAVLLLPIVLGSGLRAARRRAIRRRSRDSCGPVAASQSDPSDVDWARIARTAGRRERQRRKRLPGLIAVAGIAMLLDYADIMDALRSPGWLTVAVLATPAVLLVAFLITDPWRPPHADISIVHATVRDTVVRSHERRSGRLSGLQLSALVLDVDAAWTPDPSGDLVPRDNLVGAATLTCTFALWMTSVPGQTDLFVCSRDERIVDTVRRLATR
jgi:hypothetical protein